MIKMRWMIIKIEDKRKREVYLAKRKKSFGEKHQRKVEERIGGRLDEWERVLGGFGGVLTFSYGRNTTSWL